MTVRLARPGEVEDWEIDGPVPFASASVVVEDKDATRLVAIFVGPLGTAIAEANALTFIRGVNR